MARKATPKPGDDKKAPTSKAAKPSPRRKKVPDRLLAASQTMEQQQVAFLMHIEESNMAIPASKWIDDPESNRMVPTYGFDNGQQCVDTNRHDIARSRLAYVGKFSGPQCQQDPNNRSAWVLARRLT